MDSTGTPHGDKRATGWTTDDVPRLIRDAYPDGPDAEEPPGQAELRAWVAREMRRRLRLDRLWVLAVALPLKGLVLRRSFQAGGRWRRPWVAASSARSPSSCCATCCAPSRRASAPVGAPCFRVCWERRLSLR